MVVLFDEWARLSEDQPANQMHDKFVLKLQTAGFLKVCTFRTTATAAADPPQPSSFPLWFLAFALHHPSCGMLA